MLWISLPSFWFSFAFIHFLFSLGSIELYFMFSNEMRTVSLKRNIKNIFPNFINLTVRSALLLEWELGQEVISQFYTRYGSEVKEPQFSFVNYTFIGQHFFGNYATIFDYKTIVFSIVNTS